jgi:peroxiredoxin Q/BCP
MSDLKIGDQAPDFDLPGNGGQRVCLAEHSGKKVVLYFYPKDNTEACTLEAVDFSALRPEFEKAGAHIIGISPDSPRKHDSFCKKHDLSISLASDEETSVMAAYGVWGEKQMYGRKYMGVLRTTFLIAGDGTIAQIWPNVRVKGHAEEVLAAVKALQ